MDLVLNNVKKFDVKTLKVVLKKFDRLALIKFNNELVTEQSRLSQKLVDYNDDMKFGKKTNADGSCEGFAYRKNVINASEFSNIMSALKKVEWLMTIVWELTNLR